MLLALAPMDGITDCAFRIICKEVFDKYNENNHFLMITEFMSSDGYIANPIGVVKHLMHTEIDQPLIAQIFGGDQQILLDTATDIQSKYNFLGIELNIGCPSSKIMKVGGGSALMKDKTRTMGLIKSLKFAINTKFTIKTRVGLRKVDKQEQFEFLLEVSKYCDMIVLHGRTLDQGHSGVVDWEYIYDLKQKCAPNCTIIGNGGIKSFEDAKFYYGNLDGIMIGQASIGNPWIFTNHQPSIEEKFEVIIRHLQLLTAQEIYFNSGVFTNGILKMPNISDFEQIIDDYENKKISLDYNLQSPIEFRKHIFCYIKSLSGSKQFKQGIVGIRDYRELKEYVIKYLGIVSS